MKSFDQLERSAGTSHTAARHSLNALAQQSRAPFGTCCSVREGRSGQMDGGEDGPDCTTRGTLGSAHWRQASLWNPREAVQQIRGYMAGES